MSLDGAANPGMSYRAGGSWMSRLARSSVMAWVISIGLHAGVFLMFYEAVFQGPPAPRRLIIPEARLIAGEGGGNMSARATTEPLTFSKQASPTPAGLPAPELSELSLTPLVTGGGGEISAIAVEGGTGPVIPSQSLSAAAVEAFGGGFGNGGQGSGGGGAGGGGMGPTSSFFGQAGNAYRVVYVVDLSASLSSYLDEILRELRQSIKGLLPTQRFNIVVSKNREVLEFSASRLVPANARYKAEAMAFLDGVRDGGSADPNEAMRRAFTANPELIYFLTDGDYDNLQDELLQTLNRLNSRRLVHITTIGFDPPPKRAGRQTIAPEELLRRIAADHGGNFRVVRP